MYWLKNLFKKSEPEYHTKKIRFDEIEDALSEKIDEIKPGLELKINEFRKNFITYFESTNGNFNELESAEFDSVILEDKRDISNIVDTSRKNCCSSSKRVLSNAVAILKSETTPLEMNSTVIDVFSKLNNLSKDAQIILNCFQSEMKNVSLNLKKIKEESDEFESFLNKDYFVLNIEKRAREQTELIKSKREREERKIVNRKDIKEKVAKFEKEAELMEKEIKKIKASEEALELFNLEKEKILLKNHLAETVLEMDELVNNVSRQIKKYLHSEEVSKEEKSQIEKLLDHPKNLFKEDCAVFEKILGEAKKKIKEVEADDKKRKKFLLGEKKIKTSLKKIISERNKLLKKKEDNLGKIKEFDVKESLEKMEEKIKKINSEINQLKEDEKKIEEEPDYNEGREMGKLENLMSKCFEMDVKIK